MRRLYFLILLLLTVFFISNVFGQQRRPAQTETSNIVTFEALMLPTETGHPVRLDLNFRVMKNFFVFTRLTEPVDGFEFSGGMELNIEIFDSRGQSQARRITSRRFYSETPTLEFPDIDYYEGGFTFDLPPGEYRFLIRLTDRNSQRRFVDRDRRVTIPDIPDSDPAIFDIIFSEPKENIETATGIRPLNLGGNIFFSNDTDALVSFRSSDQDRSSHEITASIYRLGDEKSTPEELYSILVPPENIFAGTFPVVIHSDDSIRYEIIKSDIENLHTAVIPLNSKSLHEGVYRLSVKINDGNKEWDTSKIFRVIWVDKPASLRDIDFAIEMLEYILSPEEYRELRRGSSGDRRRKFLDYWRSKDPEPDTAYNPIMTEYYRRVDFAAREYSTLRERNGARTDRGRVYILYGPPTSKDRELLPGQAPQETWIYRHLRQKFIFVDQTRQGNYRLVTREDI